MKDGTGPVPLRNSANATEYHAYLRQYPDGSFAPLARIRLAVIEQAADEQAARKAAEEVRRNKAQAEEETRRKAAAEKGVQDAAELAFWESIQGSGVPADYQAYLEAFPTGQFAALAQVRAVVAALTPQQPSSERQGASISDFSGKWKGKGSLSKAAMYCPNTVSLEFEISDGVIEGQTKVRPGLQGRQGGGIKGSINATGKFEASDYYTGVGFLKIFGSVVAETGKGSGRWTLDIANELECKGPFEVSRVE